MFIFKKFFIYKSCFYLIKAFSYNVNSICTFDEEIKKIKRRIFSLTVFILYISHFNEYFWTFIKNWQNQNGQQDEQQKD